MRQAKRCGCSFQQCDNAVAGERIRVNAASSCDRGSYACQNRCKPKPCKPRPCENERRPNPGCGYGRSQRWNDGCDDFESSYRRAMNSYNCCDHRGYDHCDNDCDGYDKDDCDYRDHNRDCGCHDRRRPGDCDRRRDRHDCDDRCGFNYR